MDALNANGKAKRVRKPSYTQRKTSSQREREKKTKQQNKKHKNNKKTKNNNKKQKTKQKMYKKKCKKKRKGETDELLMFIAGKDSALFSGLRKMEVARPSDSNVRAPLSVRLSFGEYPLVGI